MKDAWRQERGRPEGLRGDGGGGGRGPGRGVGGGGRREASILTAMDSRIGGSVIQPLLAKWNEGSTVRVP